MHCTSVFYGNAPICVGEISISRSTEEYPNNKTRNDNIISDEQCSPLQGNDLNKNHSLFTIKYSPFTTTNRSHSGITLIALIITIILLLILAGVTIHFTIGENEILKNASIAGEKYEEANAKEQLTLELASIQTKTYKETGKKANLEDVKNLINKDKYNVDIEEGNTFAQIEDLEKEYTFAVDENLTIQDVEKIANKDKTIKIETSAINKSDFTTSTIKVKITLTEEISSIKIGEEEIELPAKTEEAGKNVYEIEKEVDKNGNYKVKIETVTGRANYKIQQVSNLSEDMEIYTANDLVKFRNRVEQGATFERRTITVMNDIDLSTVCGSNVKGKEVSWKPIGYKTLDPEKEDDDYTYFKGTFDGQYKHINNLYINTNEYEIAGLFCYNSGTIKNLIMNNVYIYVDYSESEHAADWGNSIGSLVGYNEGTIENVGINSGSITSINTSDATILYRTQCVGGIVASSGPGIIKQCYNRVNIEVINSTYKSSNIKPYNQVGGILGQTSSNFNIIDCYNTGNITGNGAYVNEAGGICGRILNSNTEIKNCYNYGSIATQSGSGFNLAGGIIGQNGSNNNDKATMTNTYYSDVSTLYSHWFSNHTHYTTGKTAESTLKGYTSTLNEKDEEGNEIEIWINDTGINNGYPILKWQIIKK